MKLSKLSAIRLTAASAVLFLISSCGGTTAGTADTAVVGLSAPASVSIVAEAPSSTASAAMSSSYSGTAGLSAAFNSSGTDYSKQKVDSWIKTTSGERQLEEINYFLCVVKLSNTADYPNKTYRTKHNTKLCRRPTSAWPLYGEGPLDREMLVITSRSTATAPYKQTMWFQVPYGGPFDNTDWNVVMDMTITEEPSAGNPLGSFEYYFRSIRAPDIGISYVDTSDYDGVLKAYQEGGKNYLSYIAFYENLYDADPTHRYNTYESIIIELDGSGGLSGKAITSAPRGHWNNAYVNRDISKINFNADYINEQKNSDSEVCTARANMTNTVWDYKMFYKDTGKVLNMNGGFDLTYGTTSKRGWASKYGLWTDTKGDTPSTVTRKKDSAVFNVVRAGGKLTKKTKGDRTLVTNEELVYWYNDGEYKVTWNGSTFTSSQSDSAAALSELNAATDNNARWPWSRRLNQDIKYTGTNAIVYWAEEDVKPWASELLGGDLALTCYQFCPQGEVAQALADVRSWDQSAVTEIDANAYSTSGKAYTFDSTNMLLKYSGTSVVLDPDLSSTVRSNFRMKLAPPGSTPTNWWNVDELPVHYVWRSGTKEWEQSVNFKNQSTNAWYEFSAPVKFDYTHLTANDSNDDSTYNNINYYLEYDGGLHGIPTTTLANGDKVREINLKSGDIFNGKAKHLERALVLKAVGIEKDPLVASAGSCSTLPLTDVSLTLPDSSTTISVSKTWAQQFEVPGVIAEYLVIDGVAQ